MERKEEAKVNLEKDGREYGWEVLNVQSRILISLLPKVVNYNEVLAHSDKEQVSVWSNV